MQIQQKMCGKDFSEYKRELISRNLKASPNITYGQILVKLYYNKNVFIEKEFFEEHVVSILRKENQFQQFFYLQQVFKGIEEQQNLGAEIIFVDYCDIERQRYGQSQFSMIAAVSLGGKMSCELYTTKMSTELFLQEIIEMFKQPGKQSILVFFDRNFPYENWLRKTQVAFLRDLHIFLNLPFIQAIPNPCQVLCKSIWSFVTQKCQQFQDNWEEINFLFQKIINQQQEQQLVKEIISLQWRKVQNFHVKDMQLHALINNDKVKERKVNEDRRSEEESLKYVDCVQSKLFKEENEHVRSKSIPMEQKQLLNEENQQWSQGYLKEDNQKRRKVEESYIQRNLFEEKDQSVHSKSIPMEQLLHFSKQYQFFPCHYAQQVPFMENLATLSQKEHREILTLLSRLVYEFPLSKMQLNRRNLFIKNR